MCLALGVVAADEFPDGLLQITSKPMSVRPRKAPLVRAERRDEFHLHAFTEGKFTHTHVELVADGKHSSFRDGTLEAVFGDAVNFAFSSAIRARANPP